MKCTITMMKIAGALERNGSIDKDSANHLEECNACRRLLAGNTRTAGEMGRRHGAIEKVESHLHQRVMAAVYVEAESNPRRTLFLSEYMLKTIVPLAAAASLALALMVFAWGQAGGGRDEGAMMTSNQALPGYVNSYDHALALVNTAISAPVESPYQNEVGNIKSDLAAAGNFFSGCYSYASVLK